MRMLEKGASRGYRWQAGCEEWAKGGKAEVEGMERVEGGRGTGHDSLNPATYLLCQQGLSHLV